jgi:hypothetical protein
MEACGLRAMPCRAGVDYGGSLSQAGAEAGEWLGCE